MPRSARVAPGGMVFHVINRGVGRMRLFSKPKDYDAFEEIIEETLRRRPMRICAYALMPNHWHMVLWPKANGDLHRFMHRLTVTHVVRWQHHRNRVGLGHVYQSRFKSFPVQTDDHFYRVVRYVERNPLRAGLVADVGEWRWSSLWRMAHGSSAQKKVLSTWPVERPRGWRQYVSTPQTEAELESLRRCLSRGAPFGSDRWVTRTASTLGLAHTLRARGRPRSEAR